MSPDCLCNNHCVYVSTISHIGIHAVDLRHVQFELMDFIHGAHHLNVYYSASYHMSPFRILFMSDLIVSASRNSVSFNIFAVHEICSFLRRDQISVAFSFFFCNCFEIVQALQPYIRMGLVNHSKVYLLVWMQMYLFVSTNFILWTFIFICATIDAILVLLRPSLDIKVPKLSYTRVKKQE